MNDDQYQINVGKTIYREAYQEGDVDKLLSVFASPGFIDMSDGLPSKYREEARTDLRARSEALFAEYQVKLNVIVVEILVQGDIAGVRGFHEWILTPKTGGAIVKRRDRYFERWTRQPDGAWRISLFLSNTDIPERIGESVSRWFMAEERSSPS